MLNVDLQRQLHTYTLHLNLTVGPDVLVVFGPSGSGKSMTLKMLTGIEHPDAGRLVLDGRVLFDSQAGINVPPQQRRVGYVPQQYALFPHMSALENITYPLIRGLKWSRQRGQERAHELLRLFGIDALADVRPGQLSGGQQQRVAVARALSTEPRLLLLDEPFAALDGPVRLELRAELAALQGRLGIPTIVVTHDLEEAATFATRMAIMIDGAVRQEGAVRDLLDRPRDLHVANLVQARNQLAGYVNNGALHSVLGTMPASPGFSDAVTLVARPEAFRLVGPTEELAFDELGARGTVTQAIDHGTRIVVYVELGSETIEVSITPAEGRRLSPAAGDAIGVAIHRNDLHPLAN